MITNDSIRYIKNLMRMRLSRRRNIDKICEEVVDKLEAASLASIQGAVAQIDNLILILPLPHALKVIEVLSRRAPSVLEYMSQTIDARSRQASTLLKLMETFKPSHLQKIRAALANAQDIA